jgi:heat shock 70kDa protein 4
MVKLLIGRKFDSAAVQRELSQMPFKSSKLPHGGVGISVLYDGNEVVVPAEQVFAMLLMRVKEIGFTANNGVNLADAVLAAPYWFTDAQRRAMLVASEIASLNTLKVANESMAIALSYGIFKSAKKLFSETEPTHVMFIDLGYTDYTVSIVDFIQENMQVLATVCERNLGGRDFDNAIVEYLVEVFKKKTGIDVSKNMKAILKLQAAAEKAKKSLSPSGVLETNISVECLAEDRDLSCLLTRDEFESRIAKLIGRLAAPIDRCLAEAKLTRKDLSEVEIVGGSTRVNIVKRTLGEILQLDPSAMNYGLKTTMNSDEAVARGCALQAAILSSRMKVKPFKIVDKLPYGILVHFESGSTDNSNPLAEEGDGKDESVAVKGSSAQLYVRNDDFPHKPRRLTFRNKSSSFSLRLTYDEEALSLLPPGEDSNIGTFTIRIPPDLVASGAKDVRVTFDLDRNGLVGVASAQLMEEYMEEAKEGENAEPAKKKFKKVDLEVVSECFCLSREQIKQCIELEATWANEDRLIRETADKRNELESYIYAMRTKLDGALKAYASPQEKDKLQHALTDAEDWLYNDGFDSTKQQYARKIDDLKSIGDKFEYRLSEHNGRPAAIDNLKKQIEMGKAFVANHDKDHEHITEDERAKIRDAVDKAESWLYDAQAKQADIALFVDPVLTLADINKKRMEFFNVTNPIVTKPKPKPAPAPEAEKKEAESKDESKDSAKEGASEPMDTSE